MEIFGQMSRCDWCDEDCNHIQELEKWKNRFREYCNVGKANIVKGDKN